MFAGVTSGTELTRAASATLPGGHECGVRPLRDESSDGERAAHGSERAVGAELSDRDDGVLEPFAERARWNAEGPAAVANGQHERRADPRFYAEGDGTWPSGRAHAVRNAATILAYRGGTTGLTGGAGNCAITARNFGSSVVMMSFSLPIVVARCRFDSSSASCSDCVGIADDASSPPNRS